MWGELIKYKYIYLPLNTQNIPHLSWPFNEVKFSFQILYFHRGISQRSRIALAWFSILFIRKSSPQPAHNSDIKFEWGLSNSAMRTCFYYVIWLLLLQLAKPSLGSFHGSRALKFSIYIIDFTYLKSFYRFYTSYNTSKSSRNLRIFH